MTSDLQKFRKSAVATVAFVGILWLIKGIEGSLSIDLGILGIHPRTLMGTVGILTGPLVHGDPQHLLSNSLPLIFLGIGLGYFYHKVALEVFFWIYFFTGFWVWIIARDAYHIGASGLVYGLASFLLFSGFFRKDSRSIAISLVIIFIWHGMVFGLIPGNESISYESHILGTLGGIICAFLYRNSPLKDHSQLLGSNEVNAKMEVDQENTFHTTIDSPSLKIYYHYKKESDDNEIDGD